MIRVLALWLDSNSRAPVIRAFGSKAEYIEGSNENIQELVETALNPLPNVIICGQPEVAETLLEVAQGVSLAYPGIPFIYVTTNKEKFDRAELKKNGFTDAFLVPFETVDLERYLSSLAQKNAPDATQSFRTVKLVDFQGEDPLEFDTFIYLPLNKKYIRYTHSGKMLKAEQIEKLKSHELSSLHINENDLQKFYQFTAQQLMLLGRSETLSQTEKQERVQDAIRSIVGGIFTDKPQSGFDDGRKMIGDCQEIVKSYILAAGDKDAPLYQKILAISQDGDGTYSQAANVATFAALFSIGLGIGNAEEVAMAGLLCDIGIAELPAELQMKSKEERSAAEEALYRRHPEHSVALLKAKRMIVPENVVKMIEQHHEAVNGKGYPLGLPSIRILPEAQLVGIAAEFSELMAPKAGQKRMTPKDALDFIRKNYSGSRFSSSILGQLASLLVPQAAA